MCLIAFAIGADPALPLRIAANRDEFFDRPTEPLHEWALPDGTAVWAGRDGRDGGTWLGVSAEGRVAMLTNVRSANPAPGRRSRGALPTRWLQAATGWSDLLADTVPGDHGGFNLVVGDLRSGFWAWVSNRDPEAPHSDSASALRSRLLPPGVYGLSNATLDTPWPKTVRLKTALEKAMTQAPDLTPGRPPPHAASMAPLIAALADRQPCSDTQLPSTGFPLDMERSLSSPFVDMAERGYGTRSSLILSATRSPDGQGTVEMSEWTHRPGASRPHSWSDATPRTARFQWAV